MLGEGGVGSVGGSEIRSVNWGAGGIGNVGGRESGVLEGGIESVGGGNRECWGGGEIRSVGGGGGRECWGGSGVLGEGGGLFEGSHILKRLLVAIL